MFMVSAIIRNYSGKKKAAYSFRSLQRLQSTKSYKNPIETISIQHCSGKAIAKSKILDKLRNSRHGSPPHRAVLRHSRRQAEPSG
jgi:hypothetical protein